MRFANKKINIICFVILVIIWVIFYGLIFNSRDGVLSILRQSNLFLYITLYILYFIIGVGILWFNRNIIFKRPNI